MQPDQLRPHDIDKEIDLRFVVGYDPLEFRNTLYMLADGKIDASTLVTDTVGLADSAATCRVAVLHELLEPLVELV